MIRSVKLGNVEGKRPDRIADVVDDVCATKHLLVAVMIMIDGQFRGSADGNAFAQVVFSAKEALEEISERLMAIDADVREAV